MRVPTDDAGKQVSSPVRATAPSHSKPSPVPRYQSTSPTPSGDNLQPSPIGEIQPKASLPKNPIKLIYDHPFWLGLAGLAVAIIGGLPLLVGVGHDVANDWINDLGQGLLVGGLLTILAAILVASHRARQVANPAPQPQVSVSSDQAANLTKVGVSLVSLGCLLTVLTPVVLVVGVVAVGLLVGNQPAAGSKRGTDNKIAAWTMAEEFVKDRLKSPSTANFGGLSDYQDPNKCVIGLGDGEYLVRGWVDSQNSFGATVRTDFAIKIKDEQNGQWRITEGPDMVQR